MPICLELRLAHQSEVIGAVRIALERAEVQRWIPRTLIERVEEGLVDSKQYRVEDLSQHLTMVMYMEHAHGTMRRSPHAIEQKSTGVNIQKPMHP